MTETQPDRQDGDGLLRDEQIVRQFINDGVDGNRARRALDRIMAATIQPTHDAAEGARDIARCIETIDKSYAFKTYGGIPLQNCGEWIYLKKLLAATPQPVPDAVRVLILSAWKIVGYDRAEKFCWVMRPEQVLAAFAVPVPSPDGALETVRQEIVLAISFLGRDSGTDRLQATVDALIPGLAKADAILRSYLPPSATEAAGPNAPNDQ